MSFILLAVFFIAMYYIIKRLFRAKKRVDRNHDIQHTIDDVIADQEADELQSVLDELEDNEK